MTETSAFRADIESIASIDAVPVILSMVKETTGMRFAAVARVTERNWVACAVDDSINFGLKPGGELVLESTICHEIRQHRQPVIFGKASEHPLYAQHHTPRTYGLESYISIPIVKANGDFFGTLCAIDPSPAEIDTPKVINTLTLFAQLIAMSLDVQDNLKSSQRDLADANETGRLREQFIAVLGHDLRTPLSAVRMSSELLETRVKDSSSLSLLRAIRKSALRMGTLIEDVLDFARGRLGSGIPINKKLVDDMAPLLASVIDEVRATHPNADIHQDIQIPPGIYCDPTRVSQLLSNLLGNAVTHGSLDEPILVSARVEGTNLALAVTNQGSVIPSELMPLLFQPFTRSEVAHRAEGLGLGLYIASQICLGHNGSLNVESNPHVGTCFAAQLPVQMRHVVPAL